MDVEAHIKKIDDLISVLEIDEALTLLDQVYQEVDRYLTYFDLLKWGDQISYLYFAYDVGELCLALDEPFLAHSILLTAFNRGRTHLTTLKIPNSINILKEIHELYAECCEYFGD